MNTVRLCLASSLLLVASLVARADNIPYPNPGNVAVTSSLIASATGTVVGYFVGASALDVDSIALVDVTHPFATTSFYFVNNSTAPGSTITFGNVQAGDVLEFLLYNATTGFTFSSDPAHSPDLISHAYLTTFSGGSLNGVTYDPRVYTYVGMEDLRLPYPSETDLDYNDDQFLFTNVAGSTTVTPEPSSLALLGTGVLGALGAVRRRISV